MSVVCSVERPVLMTPKLTPHTSGNALLDEIVRRGEERERKRATQQVALPPQEQERAVVPNKPASPLLNLEPSIAQRIQDALGPIRQAVEEDEQDYWEQEVDM